MDSRAQKVDVAKLPPPAKGTVDFEKDIKPIFEASCFRCHGPERPKSHFRLDNRISALQGGDNGVDIFPGNSAKSPLVHYVAGLVEDMQMPPDGKGNRLTISQISLLRAWIDQGAGWGVTNPPVQVAFSLTPVIRAISIEGDGGKFREIEGMQPGAGGGVQKFTLREQMGPDKVLTADGHVSVPDNDYRLTLELRKTDVGFVRGGFEESRKYFDDTGGYYRPFSPPAFSLGRDLGMDVGRAWVEFGLTPPKLPEIVIGYEYQFRDGTESTLEWGNVGGKNIYPASEEIHEHTHVIKARVTHEFFGLRLEDNAQVELYDLKTRHDDAASFTLGPAPDSAVRTSEAETHIQGMNALHLERQVKNWWLLSAGYLYSRLNGDASLNQATVNAMSVPTAGSFWSADGVLLERESQVLSVGNLLLPAKGFSLSAGVQAEWTRQQGMGEVHLDSGDPNLPASFLLYPAAVRSDLDQRRVSENFLARFTRIPYTVLFAEARLDQDAIGQSERDAPFAGVTADPSTTFLRNTEYSNDRHDARAGFDSSPWRWVSFGGHIDARLSDSDYDNMRVTLDPGGYPAFIRSRKIDTGEWQGKVSLKPFSWLKTTVTYKNTSTKYFTGTDPVPEATLPSVLQAGDYHANEYGVSATLTPFARLYFSGAFTWSDSRITTATHGDPSIAPYAGNVISVLGSASYILNKTTELTAAYSFSRAAYGQDNFVDGLPLGLDFTRHGLTAGISRKWTQSLSTSLRYAFYKYSEPSTGGINDYTAHGIFASLNFTWP